MGVISGKKYRELGWKLSWNRGKKDKTTKKITKVKNKEKIRQQTRIKTSSRSIKLVWKHDFVIESVETFTGTGRLRCIGIYKLGHLKSDSGRWGDEKKRPAKRHTVLVLDLKIKVMSENHQSWREKSLTGSIYVNIFTNIYIPRSIPYECPNGIEDKKT